MIMSNGKQIYAGMQKSSIFEYLWTDERGNTIKLVAQAVPSSSLGVRQYDLEINGKSFFTLPKAYEIGLKVQDHRIPGVITRKETPSITTSNRQYVNYSVSGRNLVPNPEEQVSLVYFYIS